MKKITQTPAPQVQRLAGLSTAVERLRQQYRTSSTKIELGVSHDPFKRVQAQRQLKLLVPLLRVMKALHQQGSAPSEKAKVVFAKRLAETFTAIDQMVDWADGSEQQDAELLAVCLPATVGELQSDHATWLSLGEHLERQRAIRYEQRQQLRSLASKFVESLAAEQRAMLQQHFDISGGQVFQVTPQMLARSQQ